jgi:hypothetical protein
MRLFNILAIAATVAATALIPQKASADRVCRQECSGPICQERCVETEGRGGQREGREGRREERREQRYEEREEGRGRGPGIELRVPGGSIEMGR